MHLNINKKKNCKRPSIIKNSRRDEQTLQTIITFETYEE